MESSPSPCKLDHGGLEPNAIAIYEEVMYRMLPLIHSSHFKMLQDHGGMKQIRINLPEILQGNLRGANAEFAGTRANASQVCRKVRVLRAGSKWLQKFAT